MAMPTMNKDQVMVKLYRYYLDSVWKTPSVVSTSRFLMQEVGELDSSLMKLGYQDADHERNHPPSNLFQAQSNMLMEIGQCYVMLCTLANLLQVDLTGAASGFLQSVHIKFMQSYDADKLTIARDAFEILRETGSTDAALDYIKTQEKGETDHGVSE